MGRITGAINVRFLRTRLLLRRATVRLGIVVVAMLGLAFLPLLAPDSLWHSYGDTISRALIAAAVAVIGDWIHAYGKQLERQKGPRE